MGEHICVSFIVSETAAQCPQRVCSLLAIGGMTFGKYPPFEFESKNPNIKRVRSRGCAWQVSFDVSFILVVDHVGRVLLAFVTNLCRDVDEYLNLS